MCPIRLLIVSSYPLFAEASCVAVRQFERPILVDFLVVNPLEEYEGDLRLETLPDLIVLSLGILSLSLEFMPQLHENNPGLDAALLLICTPKALPELEELIATGLKGIVTTQASLKELEAAIYALADGEPDALKRQYHSAMRSLVEPPVVTRLSCQELQILQMLATGRTDEAIAQELTLSQRTISNQLRRIYSKIGASNRAEAVSQAIVRGLIVPN